MNATFTFNRNQKLNAKQPPRKRKKIQQNSFSEFPPFNFFFPKEMARLVAAFWVERNDQSFFSFFSEAYACVAI
jgi:hypothetical protein